MPSAHHLSVSESVDCLPTVDDQSSFFDAQAQVAASIGMSASVVKQMRAGQYTYAQIETLLAQRRHVIDVIRRTKNPSTASVPPTPQSSKHPTEALGDIIASVGGTAAPAAQQVIMSARFAPPAIAPVNTGFGAEGCSSAISSSNSTTSDSPRKKNKQTETCTYQACHTCRPFFQDRLGSSFEPVLENEAPKLDELDMKALPVHKAAIVSNLGLRRPLPRDPLRRSEESMDITMHQQDGYHGLDFVGQDLPSDWTSTPTTSSDGDSDLSDKSDMSPCPGPGVCPVYHPTEGCAYDYGFDDGKREINHGHGRGDEIQVQGLGISGTGDQAPRLSTSLPSTPDLTPSKGSSVSLPNLPTTPLTGGTVLTKYSAYSLPDRSSPRSNKSSDSSEGSEVEVEGGVALTEEAVGTGTPDIAVEEEEDEEE